MDLAKIIAVAEIEVNSILKDLDTHFYFHNIEHTINVANAVQEIAVNCGLTKQELVIVTLAALFHDTGYTKAYLGHEDFSVAIAQSFLQEQNLPKPIINKITDCILATKFPQNPKDILGMVICDADFYHFSKNDYPTFEKYLRREWEVLLNQVYTDEDWNLLNFKMLSNHQYFTTYGQQNLQPLKQLNINRIKNRRGK